MTKRKNLAVVETATVEVTPDTTPTVEAPANQPEPMYYWAGNKRDLTGRGPPKADGQNRGTADAFKKLSDSKEGKGAPLAEYRAIAAARGHKGFARYAVKYGWLAVVKPAETAAAA